MTDEDREMHRLWHERKAARTEAQKKAEEEARLREAAEAEEAAIIAAESALQKAEDARLIAAEIAMEDAVLDRLRRADGPVAQVAVLHGLRVADNPLGTLRALVAHGLVTETHRRGRTVYTLTR